MGVFLCLNGLGMEGDHATVIMRRSAVPRLHRSWMRFLQRRRCRAQRSLARKRNGVHTVGQGNHFILLGHQRDDGRSARMHLGAAPVGALARKRSTSATKCALSFSPALRSVTKRAGRRETGYPLANLSTTTLIASCCEEAVVGTL